MSAINELYIENLKQELRDKALIVARKGYFMGGIPPFGYSLKEVKDEYGKRRKVYVVNEKEAKIVREAFELATAGYTLQKIADEFNKKGYRTRRGNKWTVSALYEMFQNEKYIGIFTFNKGRKRNYHAKRDDTIRVPGAVPAIVSADLWKKAREKLKLGIRKVRKRYEYPLKGLLFCGVCGSPMTTGTAGKYPSYICTKAKREHLKGHAKIGKKKIEEYVFNKIKHEIIDKLKDADFQRLTEQINLHIAEQTFETSSEIEKLSKELAEIKTKIQRGVEAILAGVDIPELKETMEQLKHRQEQIKKELLSLKTKVQKFVTPDQFQKVWKKLKELMQTDKERLAKTLIDKIIVHKDGYIEVLYKGY